MAQGIVVNGFPFGGTPTAAQAEALTEAQANGVAAALANRRGGGRVPRSGGAGDRARWPFVQGDNLTAQKARILLMLGLGRTSDQPELQRMFDEY